MSVLSRRESAARAPLLRAQPAANVGARADAERFIFLLFVAALAWCPFWFGSNERLAWGVNAILFPGARAHRSHLARR